MRALLAVLLLCLSAMAHAGGASCSGPACCVRYGVAAVCHSPIIEAKAKALVMRRCPTCRPSDIDNWISSYQTNEGPYKSSGELARDVYCAIKGCS